MAVKINFVTFIIFAARIIHQHHVVIQQVLVTIFFQERHRRILCSLYRISLLVLACPGKLGGRNAQVEHQHTVYGAQHLRLVLLERRLFGPLCGAVAQLQTILTQFFGNQPCHARCILTAVRLGHHLFGYQAIFRDNVSHPGKRAAITQRIAEEPFHHFVIHRLFAGIDNALQEKIGLLQLIPEEVVVLRKFKRPQSIPGYCFGTHHVQPGEQPATARRLLICNSF